MNKECGHLASRRRDHQESLQMDSTLKEKPILMSMPNAKFAPEVFFFFLEGGGVRWKSNEFSYFLIHSVLNFLLLVTKKVLTYKKERKKEHNVFK